MKSQDVAFWKEAINDEMDSIMSNNTWMLADLSPGCKWIFKRKLKMDVKIAFLNGELDEEVYMNQSQRFIMFGNENKVCKLIKSLYGLKQTPKQWHQKFDEVVLSNGYLLNQTDKCVYSKFDESSKGVVICLYVDDMLIFGTDQPGKLVDPKNMLSKSRRTLAAICNFYPKNIVTIDLSYSHIKHLWTTPKCFRRLKFMKLRYCLYLTSTQDFTNIANLEELILEAWNNFSSLPRSLSQLSQLGRLELGLQDAGSVARTSTYQLSIFRDSMSRLIYNFPRLYKPIFFLPSVCGKLTESWEEAKEFITFCFPENNVEVECGVRLVCDEALEQDDTNLSMLLDLPTLSQHDFYPENIVTIDMSYSHIKHLWTTPKCFRRLKFMKLSYSNLVQVPESIGGLSCLTGLNLSGNKFSSLLGSLSQFSQLGRLELEGCKKLEVLPVLPPSLESVSTRDCTSLCPVTISSIDPILTYLRNCPKLFTNLAIDSQLSMISETQCLDSSITFQGSTNQFSSFHQKLIESWEEAKEFITFCFHENNVEVKECGVQLVCDEDLEQDDTNLSMLLDLPTLSQHGGSICLSMVRGKFIWSW
nr:zinc finger, CCHC-type [Tanacetum cinerariifolium]